MDIRKVPKHSFLFVSLLSMGLTKPDPIKEAATEKTPDTCQ